MSIHWIEPIAKLEVARDLAKTDPTDKTWQEFANCLREDPDNFFPERGASTRAAREVCRGCVVKEDCLEYALNNDEKFGIWGGMGERERRRIRRARALARVGIPGNAINVELSANQEVI